VDGHAIEGFGLPHLARAGLSVEPNLKLAQAETRADCAFTIQAVYHGKSNFKHHGIPDVVIETPLRHLFGRVVMGTILEAKNLSFSYARRTIWHDVSLSLSPGDIALLWGVNGAGKTTLLRCLAGWSRPNEGTVAVCGRDLARSTRREGSDVFFVSDTPPFYEDLTAREHILFLLRANGLSDREAHALELADRFHLAESLDAYPSSFSRGMRYKLAIVLALSLAPALLLMDEPYGPIDHTSAVLLSHEIELLAASGSAVLLSCHQVPPELAATMQLELEDKVLDVKKSTAEMMP